MQRAWPVIAAASSSLNPGVVRIVDDHVSFPDVGNKVTIRTAMSEVSPQPESVLPVVGDAPHWNCHTFPLLVRNNTRVSGNNKPYSTICANRSPMRLTGADAGHGAQRSQMRVNRHGKRR
ncbi:hypothetical protein [Paenibacillus xerothermodurans]|uniref:hypothetical protein n=1 Tax=Paenibacillus xerothermodurans TaxID=1977292 RepID=UPI0010582515|nr:hypothetical protein [Paenibacillus xerothermodurans]